MNNSFDVGGQINPVSGARYETNGAVATISIQGFDSRVGPPTLTAMAGVSRFLTKFDEDPNLRAALIRGDADQPDGSDQIFDSTGAADPGDTSDMSVVFPALYRPSKPVVAAITGPCLEAGLILMGAISDIRVAGTGARFGFGRLRPPLGAATIRSRLAKQIPYTSIMWMAVAGQEYSADEALRVGLVNQVVPDADVIDTAAAAALAISELGVIPRAEKVTLILMEEALYDDGVFYGSARGLLNALRPSARDGLVKFVGA